MAAGDRSRDADAERAARGRQRAALPEDVMRRALRGILPLLLFVLASEAAAQSTVVILVRHAEEAEPDATNSVLSAAGVARADSLVAALAHVPLAAVYSTQYIRTRDTASPVAKAQGVPHHVVEATRPAEVYLAALAERIRAQHAGETVLVVGHSNSTTQLIHALGGPELPALDESDHARFFVLVLDAGGGARLLDARFGQR
jgi:broad specificity phosphatase PhoE